MAPLFSIAVTTYNRPDFLAACLRSVLAQTEQAIEVLVGNDFVAQAVSAEALGIHDPRVKVYNHPQNLGELENMNFLLREARGKYFTWLADDDALLPGFLSATRSALDTHPDLNCAYTLFALGSEIPSTIPVVAPAERISGERFLERYLSREISVVGCYGLFRTEFIRARGGMHRLSPRLSPYSDNRIALAVGLEQELVFIPSPLVFLRGHTQSASYTSADLEDYFLAQKALVGFSADVFARFSPERAALFQEWLLRWLAVDFFAVWSRQRKATLGLLVGYLLRFWVWSQVCSFLTRLRLGARLLVWGVKFGWRKAVGSG